MKIPNPKNYDFLWLVYGHTFFETSFHLTQEFLERDFLVTHKGAEWKVYVGKEERGRLGQLGLHFFRKHFSQYKIKVKKIILKSNLFFKRIATRDFSSLSNLEFYKKFLKIIDFAQYISSLYFFTEYFLYDKIQVIIERGGKKGKKLAVQIQEMQRLKFNLRKVVDKFVFRGNIFESYPQEIERRTKRKNLHFYHYQEVANLLVGKKVRKVNRQNYVWGKFNNWRVITGRKL